MNTVWVSVVSAAFACLAYAAPAGAADDTADCRQAFETTCLKGHLAPDACRAALPEGCELPPPPPHNAAMDQLREACGEELMHSCHASSHGPEAFVACLEASGTSECQSAAKALPPPPAPPPSR